MCDRYDNSDSDDDKYSSMDELLCEYVDGTMDCVTRRAFEELLQSDLEFAEHVNELMQTRAILCDYRWRMNAPNGFSGRLQRELTDEMMRAQEPILTENSHRLRQATTLSSIMVAMLLAGLMSGSLLADTETVRVQQSGVVSTEGNGEPSLFYTFDREPVYRVWQSSFGFSGFRQSSAYLPANDSLRPRLENAAERSFRLVHP